MKALDLCCGAGGASRGLVQAGYTVVGIDIEYQKSYPYEFIQADCLTLDLDFIRSFDLVWASFPCQAYSRATQSFRLDGRVYADLVGSGRDMLLSAGVPFVMENVIGSPLRYDLMLCGKMFGLQSYRHRVFEIEGFKVARLFHPVHRYKCKRFLDDVGVYYSVFGHNLGTSVQWAQAMGIEDRLSKKELAQAIPPAYSRYIAGYASGVHVADMFDLIAV